MHTSAATTPSCTPHCGTGPERHSRSRRPTTPTPRSQSYPGRVRAGDTAHETENGMDPVVGTPALGRVKEVAMRHERRSGLGGRAVLAALVRLPRGLRGFRTRLLVLTWASMRPART